MKCQNCEVGILELNDEWDKEFDRLDSNVPAGDIIADKLAQRGIPKYICKDCGHGVIER